MEDPNWLFTKLEGNSSLLPGQGKDSDPPEHQDTPDNNAITLDLDSSHEYSWHDLDFLLSPGSTPEDMLSSWDPDNHHTISSKSNGTLYSIDSLQDDLLWHTPVDDDPVAKTTMDKVNER